MSLLKASFDSLLNAAGVPKSKTKGGEERVESVKCFTLNKSSALW